MDFLKFQVRAAIVGNYKNDRLYGRGEEYGDAIIAGAVQDLKTRGEFWISRHESISGSVIGFKLDNGCLLQIS